MVCLYTLEIVALSSLYTFARAQTHMLAYGVCMCIVCANCVYGIF